MLEKLKKQRAELDQIIAEIESQAVKSVKEWNPEGGDFYIDVYGTVECNLSDVESKNFGTERKTEELAKKAAREMRVFNRLLAYRDEFCPDYNPLDLSHYWFVFFFNEESKFRACLHLSVRTPGLVYFPEDVAKQLAEKLNSGEVKL